MVVEPVRRRRAPEARRRAIVEAAAGMLVEARGELTHRAVAARAGVPLGATTYYFTSLHELRGAALDQLADEVTVGLGEVAEQVAAAQGDPRVLASLLHTHLSDQDQVRADAALYHAAIQHPDLRHIAMRWVEGFVNLASAWTDPMSARAIAVFIDGASMHAALSGAPLDQAVLERALTALLQPRSDQP